MAGGSDRRDLERMESSPVHVTVREQGGGLVFGIGGIVVALFAAWQLFTIIPGMLSGLSACGEPSDFTVGTLRTAALITVAAGVAAVALCELGVRREMQPKVLGAAGSVVGIFAVLGAGTAFVMMLVPSLADCFTA